MNKKLLCAIGAATLLASAAPAAYAADTTQAPAPETPTVVSEITPRADIIQYKYRLLNGKQQYRRWNATRGYWVDPEWIDL